MATLPLERGERERTPCAVLGTGMMGPGIASTYALAGHPITLYGRSPESLARGLKAAEAALALFVEGGIATAAAAREARARLHGSTDLAGAVRDAAVVFESVAEDLALKQALFAELEGLVGEQAILASNTSGLPITQIAARMRRPERAVTAHFWNPPHLMPLVEIVKGERTSDETVARMRALLAVPGKRPVVVLKDTPGQLGNRLQHALSREAFYLVMEGVASAEDVDVAITAGPGRRWAAFGPLEIADMAGLDLVLAVHSYVAPALRGGGEATGILREHVERGELGIKSGRGFYDWGARDGAAARAARDRYLLARLKDELELQGGEAR